jgi:pimeloyl-ACP methyl ester carboxylesterase
MRLRGPERPRGPTTRKPVKEEREGKHGAGAATTEAAADVDRERFERHRERSVFYPYPGPVRDVRVVADQRRGRLRILEVRYESPLPSGHAARDVVKARLFLRSDFADGPPIVLLHGFGARTLGFWDSQAAGLARRGFPTLLVCLPHMCERAPRGERRGYAYMSTHAGVALPAYEQAVADTRAGLDWLLEGSPLAGCAPGNRPGPAVVGISLGAVVAVIAAALEPRFESVVPMLGGGDLDLIVFRGSYRTPVPRELREANIGLENRRNARRIYEGYLEEVRRSKSPLDVFPEFHFFLFDPLTFASSLRTRPVLMMNGLFDPVIPREAANQLWLELGRPQISWFWGTHWTGGPWKPFVLARLERFLSGLEPGALRQPKEGYAKWRVPEA